VAATLSRPLITPGDRLEMTVCFAVICHAILILGVGFGPEHKPKPRFETMEIVLVQSHSEPAAAPDYLAQANLEGGGDEDAAARPAAPLNAPLPEISPQLATPTAEAVETAAQTPQPVPAEATAPPTPDAPQTMVAETDTPEPDQVLPQPPEAEAPPAEPPDDGQQAESRAARSLPSAAQLIASSFAIASLNAEIQRRLEAKAKRPRRKFVSASTREYQYAAYMEAWRAKVERIGNLNYPEEARRRRLAGSLILEVVLKPDGGVNETVVRRSSGYKALDDAAIRIVELAAPFAPFPDDIAREVDLLHVTRTWQFLNSYRFATQ
jgi:protein TonB